MKQPPTSALFAKKRAGGGRRRRTYSAWGYDRDEREEVMVAALNVRTCRRQPSVFRRSFSSQRERDDESSLMHFRARSYDPRVGRFIQNDPILALRHSSHYSYADCEPTFKRDPLGHRALTDEEEKVSHRLTLEADWYFKFSKYLKEIDADPAQVDDLSNFGHSLVYTQQNFALNIASEQTSGDTFLQFLTGFNPKGIRAASYGELREAAILLNEDLQESYGMGVTPEVAKRLMQPRAAASAISPKRAIRLTKRLISILLEARNTITLEKLIKKASKGLKGSSRLDVVTESVVWEVKAYTGKLGGEKIAEQLRRYKGLIRRGEEGLSKGSKLQLLIGENTNLTSPFMEFLKREGIRVFKIAGEALEEIPLQ